MLKTVLMSSALAVWGVLGAAPAPLVAQCEWVLAGPGNNWREHGSAAVASYDAHRRRTVVLARGVWEWNGDAWLHRSDISIPQALGFVHSAAMVYDAARQRSVLFGGFGGSGPGAGGMWQYDGDAWTHIAAPGPSTRSAHAMAYDSHRQRIVLFGGQVGDPLGDTWEWDGTSWLQRAPSISPAPRWGHAMAYDNMRQRTVVFGGSSGERLGDTWEWDGEVWAQVSTGGPSPRIEHSMVFDAARQRTILFGGNAASGALGDHWEWDGEFWSQIQLPDPAPAARGHASLVYDELEGRALLIAGDGLGSYIARRDTWSFDGERWNLLHDNPVPRAMHAVEYDPVRHETLIINGFHVDPSASTQTTWAWDGQVWHLRAGQAPLPPTVPTMWAMASAFDEARGELVVFGGSGMSIGSRTWAWDGAQWHLRSTAGPSPREHHAMAYDAARQRIVLYGGYVNNVFVSDTWEWDGTAWQQIAAAGPGPLGGHRMAFDPVRAEVLLFGASGELWAYNGAAWVLRGTGGPGRAAHGMAFDRVRDRLVIFGGAGGGITLDDTWEWDGSAWSRLQISGPVEREFTSMTWDRARQRTVLFGGMNYTRTPLILEDTWELVCERPCYANCDGSTVEPVLNVDDFTCFINEFAAAQGLPHEQQIAHYANCDGSTITPVLNVDDFTCFINTFAGGCP